MNAAAIASIGIDLGKTIFHLVALDCDAGVIVRKKFSLVATAVVAAIGNGAAFGNGSRLGKSTVHSFAPQ